MKQRSGYCVAKIVVFAPRGAGHFVDDGLGPFNVRRPHPLVREQWDTRFKPDLLRFGRREILQRERPFLGQPLQLLIEVRPPGLLLDQDNIDPVSGREVVDPLTKPLRSAGISASGTPRRRGRPRHASVSIALGA